MSHVFPRVLTRTLPTAVSAEGVWIVDADGRRYLDGSGGAIVVGVGHGDASLIAAADEQLRRTQYAHPTMFTTDAVEGYADDVATVLPLADARVYPVSGGSEAVETALKMARAYHLARGNPGRVTVIARGVPATTGTRSAPWTPPGRSRSASRTRLGSAGSCTRRRRTSTDARTLRTPMAAGTGTRRS